MAEAAQGMIQGNELRQEQTLTPQQLQSLDILYAPVLELQQKVNQELNTNPILEVAEPESEPEPEPSAPAEEDAPELGSERDDMEEELAKILQLTASGYASPAEAALPSGYDPQSRPRSGMVVIYETLSDRRTALRHCGSCRLAALFLPVSAALCGADF